MDRNVNEMLSGSNTINLSLLKDMNMLIKYKTNNKTLTPLQNIVQINYKAVKRILAC